MSIKVPQMEKLLITNSGVNVALWLRHTWDAIKHSTRLGILTSDHLYSVKLLKNKISGEYSEESTSVVQVLAFVKIKFMSFGGRQIE